MELGMPELLIVLVIIILIFGVGRISKIGGELGEGIKAFRSGLQNETEQQEVIPAALDGKADVLVPGETDNKVTS
jgi:sec-independent protein translocase protein TatA